MASSSVSSYHYHRFNFLQGSIWISTTQQQQKGGIIKWKKSNNYSVNLRRATTNTTTIIVAAVAVNNDDDSSDQNINIIPHDQNALLTIIPLVQGGTSPSSDNNKKKHDVSTTFTETIVSSLPIPPLLFMFKPRAVASNWAIGLCIAAAFFGIALRAYVVRKSNSQQRPGSVSDLVRRGQLRSDRRGISAPLKYEDPFNNPMVKIDKGNSTVEMCGKVYRLAPITLTKEEQTIHQKRRSRAYQWTRPTVFLKEGDPVPADVDPDSISWIPSNHPFATTASDIDEDLAQNNVYQKHGVPFRIQAEHEALQKKFEALQNEQKLNKLVIDGSAAKDFERSFKMNSQLQEPVEQNPFDNQAANSKPPKLDDAPGRSSSSEQAERP